MVLHIIFVLFINGKWIFFFLIYGKHSIAISENPVGYYLATLGSLKHTWKLKKNTWATVLRMIFLLFFINNFLTFCQFSRSPFTRYCQRDNRTMYCLIGITNAWKVATFWQHAFSLLLNMKLINLIHMSVKSYKGSGHPSAGLSKEGIMASSKQISKIFQ